MKLKHFLFLLAVVILTTITTSCEKIDQGSESDATNGKKPKVTTKGTAFANNRGQCDWVQLWAGGPKWATFNIGATITDYSNLKIGADYSPLADEDKDLAPYYNTANVGGLYAWCCYRDPDEDARRKLWIRPLSSHTRDVATELWGWQWKTPSHAQLDTLQNSKYTHWTWCDGVVTQCEKGCPLKGYAIEGLGEYKNNHIFLPSAGEYAPDSFAYIVNTGYYGGYWSSDLSYDTQAICLLTTPSGRNVVSTNYNSGLSVRAILKE